MANVKLSALPEVVSVSNNDIVPTVASSITSKLTISNLAASMPQVTSSISASLAYTSSYVNTLNQSVVITGSLNISGSVNSITVNNGFAVLTQVSRSLNFVDDAAAATGGVPLGGLYRSGSIIVIRLV